jgi:hydroxyacylglutathione hydrolase
MRPVSFPDPGATSGQRVSFVAPRLTPRLCLTITAWVLLARPATPAPSSRPAPARAGQLEDLQKPPSESKGRTEPVVISRGAKGAQVLFLAGAKGDANCYAVVDVAAAQAAVIDPGRQRAPAMKEYCDGRGIRISHVLVTHSHGDHIGGLEYLIRTTEAKIVIHRVEAESLPDNCRPFEHGKPTAVHDRFLFRTDEQTVDVGTARFRVLLIPGHTLASLAYELPEAKMVFTGDVLFQGTVGNTDLARSAGLVCLVAYTKAGLFTLDDQTRVLPGHGQFTTIERERRTNPFLGEKTRGGP